MATDARGHTVPAATDAPKRADILALGLSINDPIVVANTTARAQALTDLAAESIVPSSASPLFFFRVDAGIGRQLEYTTDGTTFESIPTVGRSSPFALAAGIVTINTTVATVNTIAVTFPAGRFTQTPIMPAPNVATAAGGTGGMTARAIPSSASGGTIYLYSAPGTNFSAGISVPIHWTAFQMKSTTAAG